MTHPTRRPVKDADIGLVSTTMARKFIVVLLVLLTTGVVLVWLKTRSTEHWGREWEFETQQGVGIIAIADSELAFGHVGDVRPSDPVSFRFSFGGLVVDVNAYQKGQLTVVVPLWFLTGLLALYPTLVFIRGPASRWRRRRKGLCVVCAYNLKGNVSGVCPECGMETKKP